MNATLKQVIADTAPADANVAAIISSMEAQGILTEVAALRQGPELLQKNCGVKPGHAFEIIDEIIAIKNKASQGGPAASGPAAADPVMRIPEEKMYATDRADDETETDRKYQRYLHQMQRQQHSQRVALRTVAHDEYATRRQLASEAECEMSQLAFQFVCSFARSSR